MKELFGTAVPIEEARAVAKARAGEGKKPGQNLFIILLATLVIFLINSTITTIASLIFLGVSNASNGGMEKAMEQLKNHEYSASMIIFSLYLTVIPIILYALYAKVIEKRKITSLGFVKKKMLPSYLLGLVLAVLLMGFAAGFGVITGAMTITKGEIGVGTLILFITCWMIQGLSEEVMCRGFLMTSIARRYSVTLGVIINSIVFAVCHLGNPGVTGLAVINLFMFGVFMSLLFIRTENIWACAACHSAWNCIQGNVLGIAVSGMPVQTAFTTTFNEKMPIINGGAFGLEGGLAVTIMLVIAITVLLISIKKRNKKA